MQDFDLQSQDESPMRCDKCGSLAYKTVGTRTHDRYLCLATNRHVMEVEKQPGQRIPVQRGRPTNPAA